ncbi:MAG: DNA recombination protein RmuC [Actinobacteria bacterium]|nr:DNA recombination protein RmuC [Actinomycetota bacterium]
MEAVLGLLGAVVVGLVVALVVQRQQRAGTQALVGDLRRELEAQRDSSLSATIETVVSIAREQLGSASAAGVTALDQRNELMDQRIDGMHTELQRMTALVRELESQRARSLGELSEQLAHTGTTTAELAKVTQTLRQALSSSSSRGQWGERMADDVLRAAGFVEGMNYRRQAATAAGRPDFTFLLPDDRCVHMDVKFPLDNYLRYLDAGDDAARELHGKAFLRDVRARVKELTTRDYIDPSAGTLDHVLLFIPNEHVYAFVHERDNGLLDLALEHRVVLCSPLTLFSVLSVIRTAVDNFALERTSGEILELLGSFRKQWDLFAGQMDKVGDRLDAARKEYDGLVTTRRRQLERQLDKVDELRDEHALADRPALVALERETG